jgi:hypothetical protein
MVTTGVSSASTSQPDLTTYFKTRQADLKQLGQDLKSGDMTDAEQEYQTIVTLGQSGPFASGREFAVSQRQQDFNAIGQALQGNSLSGATQAFTSLENSFHPGHVQDPPTPVAAPPSGGSSQSDDVEAAGQAIALSVTA